MRLATSPRRAVSVAATFLVLLLLPAAPALGHAERHTTFPDGNGSTPKLLTAKTARDTLLVCKRDSRDHFAAFPPKLRERNQRLYRRCMDDGFRHIQAAVNAVKRKNTRILVLPGVYQEEPSRRAHRAGCDNLDGDSNGDERGTPSILTYAQQRRCPHVQNLITIFGDGPDPGRECDRPQCGLQIEGTGRQRTDVILDGQFKVLNGIRADRADGVRFTNFTVQRFEFNALYVLETDGFLIRNMLGRWNDEYSFLTFASDHGLYNGCESYGNGDGAVYPGSASDINTNKGLGPVQRYSIEIRHCRGHHSALGYSGTAGNSVYVHHNSFDHNAAGLVTDSLFPDHPGLPQDHGVFVRNRIFSNNKNYFKYVHNGTCDKPFMQRGMEHGTVCPVIPAPVGSGLVIAGGNYNRIFSNNIFDNWRNGTFLFNVPAALRNEDDPDKQFDTSHWNRTRRNRLGFGIDGNWQPNGTDFWWDDQGKGNCWQGNDAMRGAPTHNANPLLHPPDGLPSCDEGGSMGFVPANGAKIGPMAPCATYNRRGSEEEQNPPGCDFFRSQPRPDDRQPKRPSTSRTRGSSDIGTAVGVSRRAFSDGANAVVIAPANDARAALVAAPLAGEVSGPLLLTNPSRLSRSTADEVRRLDAGRAYVVGDTSGAVARTLRDVGVRQVTRLDGGSAYATAAKVARLMGGTEVYVTRASSPEHPSAAHAYGIAGLAASQQRPILFTRRHELPRATKNALADMAVMNATLFGGRSRISAGVARAVDRRAVIVDRVDGASRFNLSAQAANLALRGIADESVLWVANGRNTLDSIVAAGAAAQKGGVVLSIHKGNLDWSAASKRWLRNHQVDLRRLTIIGGARRVSDRAAAQIRSITG